MSRPLPVPPDDVAAAARARAAARAARDWGRADALKSEIEAAGWKVVDRGTDYHLEPATAPTIEEDGVVRYGSASAVPSVLDEPASAPFSIQVVADERPDDLSRLLAGLRAHAPTGTQVVIVANDPAPHQVDRLVAGGADVAPIAGEAPEVLWTSVRLGPAAARNVGLRRARGDVVVFAAPTVEPTGDALGPLAATLADPSVAVAGAVGLATVDLRRWDEVPGPEVDAVAADWLAFRRADLAALGPLDEKIALEDGVAAWWSLVLRAGGDPDSLARRAVRLDLPVARHEPPPAPPIASQRERLAKRDYYRLLDRFRGRIDLVSPAR